MSILHVHIACPYCMCILHVHIACPYCMTILNAHIACPYCMSILHVHINKQRELRLSFQQLNGKTVNVIRDWGKVGYVLRQRRVSESVKMVKCYVVNVQKRSGLCLFRLFFAIFNQCVYLKEMPICKKGLTICLSWIVKSRSNPLLRPWSIKQFS